MKIRKPAEWERQQSVMLAWPHVETDWGFNLEKIVPVYQKLVGILAERQPLWILCRKEAEVKSALGKSGRAGIRFIEVPFNDTWVRDYGPFFVYDHDVPVLLDYQFNGWGGRFEAAKDNRVTSRLYEKGCFGGKTAYRNRLDFVLEGGAVETNGMGLMLATKRSILAPGRNAFCGVEAVELRLRNDMGIEKVLWLNNGWLEGDDTDGHIDMLARFCDENTICYVRCENEMDPHFRVLKMMEEELQHLRGIDDKPFRLLPLPLPDPVYNDTGYRLPASYANFLIMNDAVILPMYNCSADETAREILSGAFPGKDIIGIEAGPLIEQGGSVHCATMQLPEGI